MAAGQANGPSYAPLAASWNGTTWTLQTTPTTGLGSGPFFNAVSCTTSTMCVAVGNADEGNESLAEQWNGTAWSIVSTPNPAGQSIVDLTGVSCIGSAWCTAVGQGFVTGTGYQSLVEQWNGSAWSIVPSPNVSTVNNFLQGVDCFSMTSCSAVGYAGEVTQALAWNGTAWTAATTPNQTGADSTQLNAVSCVTDWACVGLGNSDIAGIPSPFAASAPIARSGYRFAASDGGVFSYGSGAPFLGSMGGTPLNQPIVGLAVMPAGDGYYLVAADGGVFNFGSAKFYGSTGGTHLNAPVVGMAVTADGGGYWLVAADGGMFTYGDAQFYGSAGSLHLNKPIVGMAATPDGRGYYLVASDGGIFNYGDATFLGSAGSLHLNKPVVGMAAPVTGGYYLVASDGGIFTYPTTGGPTFYGSSGSIKLNKPIVGMTAVSNGYYLSGFGRRGLRLPDHQRPDLLRLHGLHRAQQAHRGDLRLADCPQNRNVF